MEDMTGTDGIVYLIEEELSKIAGKDGTITAEEQALINSIMTEVTKYKDVLDQSLSDGKITQQERIRLFQGKLNIIHKAVGKIKDDMMVSQDEQAIVNGLQGLLPKITEYEEKFTEK